MVRSDFIVVVHVQLQHRIAFGAGLHNPRKQGRGEAFRREFAFPTHRSRHFARGQSRVHARDSRSTPERVFDIAGDFSGACDRDRNPGLVDFEKSPLHGWSSSSATPCSICVFGPSERIRSVLPRQRVSSERGFRFFVGVLHHVHRSGCVVETQAVGHFARVSGG